jgi:hypothetical protein
MCWISVPPSATASSCWPPQHAQYGHVAAKRTLGQREFRFGAVFLEGHGGVAGTVAIQRRINVECAARHDQAVDEVEIISRQRRVVRHRDRQPARRGYRVQVVSAQCIPGVLRVAAGLLGIQGHADDGSSAHVPLLDPGGQSGQESGYEWTE